MIKYFVDQNVSLNLKNVDGLTPFDIALNSENDLIAQFLSDRLDIKEV